MSAPPVRVVYLLDSLKRGGVQQGALMQIPQLDTGQYAAEVWTLRQGGENDALRKDFQNAGILLRDFPVKGYRDRRGILLLARALDQVDLLNSKSFFPNMVGRLAAWLSGKPAVVANYHHSYEHKWNPRFESWEKILSPHTNAFLCVSEKVREVIQPIGQWPDGKVQVVYNGLPLSDYSPKADSLSFREKLDLPRQGPLLLTVSRLTKVKNLEVLLEALPPVITTFPEAALLIAGEGEQRKNLEQKAKALQITGHVRFLGSRPDVPELMAASDMVVLPSLLEGFPRVMLESFAAGRPFISTPAGGTLELLRHGENGLCVPFSEPGALTAAILETLQQPEDTQKRVHRALQDIQTFSLENWTGETEAVFAVALQEKARYGLGSCARWPGLLKTWRYGQFQLAQRCEEKKRKKAVP